MEKIEFKMHEISNMKVALSKLIEKELPISIAFRLGKFTKKVEELLSQIEEYRIKVVTKWGVRNDETEQIEVPKDKMNEFFSEMSELFNETVSLEFDLIDIKVIENIDLSTKDILALDKLFKA